MADTRLPDRWLGDPQMELLSDGAWRLFTGGLMYSNRYGKDGKIPRVALHYCYPTGERLDLAQELVDAGLWKATPTHWLHVGWTEWQSTKAQVDKSREDGKRRSREWRERQAAERDALRDAAGSQNLPAEIEPPPAADAPPHAGNPSRNASRDASHNASLLRTGQDQGLLLRGGSELTDAEKRDYVFNRSKGRSYESQL